MTRFAKGGGSAAVSQDADEPSRQAIIEEWLMSVELPQPLKPVLGSGAWASFAAAIAQMTVVAFLAGLGTFLEQGGPPEFYAKQYPELSGIILTLGLDHVYSSPFFLALLAWLALSLIACTGTTQLPLAKRAQRLALRSSGYVQRAGNFLVRVNCPAADGIEAMTLTTPRLRALQAELRRRDFVVRTDDEAAPTQLVATRGLVGKFAPMFVHLALILSLLGNTVGLLFGSSSEVMIGDGGEADLGRVLDAGRRIKGPFYDFFSPIKSLMDKTTIKVEDFRIDYRETGQVEQFYSKLVVEDAASKQPLYNDEIYVNKPMRYGGATIYQANWGIDRLQLYLNGAPVVVPLRPLPAEDGERQWGGFLPEELVKSKDPSSLKQIKRPTSGIVLVVANMRNVQVFGIDKTLKGILRSPDAKVDQNMEGMPIQFGEEITVDGATLRLDKILGQTGLIVKSDPGVPLVYLSYALLMPATLLSVLPFSQVWAAVSEEDKKQILISGKSNRNQLSFEDEIKAMILGGAI